MKLKLSERLGLINGYGLGLMTAAISFARQSRMFHPLGVTYTAQVTSLGAELKFPPSALLRFSSAWWKKREWRDVLGVGIRFSEASQFSEVAQPGDQDLLFATILHPWTLPFAPLTTRFHDFLANPYYAVSPFAVPGRAENDWVEFRLIPRQESPDGKDRGARLAEAVRQNLAAFDLQQRALKDPKDAWAVVARLELSAPIALDQEALQFSPFRDGMHLLPRGYVHYLRVGAYGASQKVRPKHQHN